jgi:hypothetical protein
VPRIDFTDSELAAGTAAVRGVIKGDRFPHTPPIDSHRTALAKFDDMPKPSAACTIGASPSVEA